MTADIKSPSVISLPRPSGRVTLFNTSRTDIVPLKKVSKQEMLELLAAFRIELRRWLLGELCVPRYDLDIKRMGGTAPGLLAGLSGSLMRVPGPNSGHAYRWDLFYLQTGKSSNRSLALAERHSPVSRGTQRTSVLNMPIESQVEYLKSIVGENGEYAFEVAEPTLAARYAAAHLEEALSSAELVPEFLVATVTALGRGTTDGERRIPSTDLGTMMFLAFLHRHGLVLLPASCVYFRWNELRTDPFCFPEWLEQHLRALLVYMGERKRTTFTPQQLLRQARAVHLMSTLSEPADISADLCHRFRDLHPKQPRVVWATNMLVRGTKAILASPQQHALRVEAMRTADLLQLSKRAAQDTAPAKNPRSAIDRFPSEPGDKRDVLSADSPDCIGIPRPGGEADIIVNTSVHSLVVLKSTDKAGMEDLIRQFRCEQRQWLMRELSLPREDLTPLRARAGAPSLLYGLSGTFNSTDRKHSDRWRFRNIALVGEQGTAAIAFARQWPPPPGGSPLSSVLRMPQEAQLTFLRHVLGQNGEFALESLSPRFAQSFACRELEAWLGESTGTGEFLARVMRRAVARGDDSGPGGRDEIGPVLFLTFLRSREIILLPAAAYVFRWSTICSSPLPFFAPWLLEHAERVMLALRSEALTPFREQGLQKAIRALWLMSSVSKPCDIAPALCDALRTVLKPQPEAGGALSTLVETMAHLLGHVAPGERLSRKARLLLRPECGHAPGGQSHLGNDRAQPGGTYSATSLVLSPDLEHILRCDTRNDNQQTLLNTSADALVMLRKIGRREMISYISDFRKEQTGWLMSLLEAPRRDISWRTVGEDYPELIYGLSGALSDATRQHGFEKEWMLYHLSRGGPARDAARIPKRASDHSRRDSTNRPAPADAGGAVAISASLHRKSWRAPA